MQCDGDVDGNRYFSKEPNLIKPNYAKENPAFQGIRALAVASKRGKIAFDQIVIDKLRG